tara:strand:+ start:407 stop:607 length:201 start_codon:yes stop_codon:yes gene_type:complete
MKTETIDMADGYPGERAYLVKRSGGDLDCVIAVHRTERLAREMAGDLNRRPQSEYHYWVEKHAIRN